MKMIKPIVNISKIIDGYDVIIVGLEGVICEGASFRVDAINALLNMKKLGKKIILLSNSSMRISEVLSLFKANKLPALVFDRIITAGEILHYLFKSSKSSFSALGKKYYNLGNPQDEQIFENLSDYKQTHSLAQADFLFMGRVKNEDDSLESYVPTLSQAASMSIPLVAVGNDLATFAGIEKPVLAAGAIAEQYAALGGRILTIGKPSRLVFDYALEDTNFVPEQTLLIGDSITSDIRGANLAGIPSVLVSKGIHINYLGEGYIPDVTKTRELASNYDVYPDFVVSCLRW